MRESLYHKTKHVNGMTSASISSNTATNGASIDLAQASGGDWRTCLFLVTGGTITDGTYTLSLEDSDNGSAWAAVTGSDKVLGPSSTVTATGGTAEIEYAGNRRYCRLVVTSTGVTTGGAISARAVLGGSAKVRR